jgi:hypothetical protein
MAERAEHDAAATFHGELPALRRWDFDTVSDQITQPSLLMVGAVSEPRARRVSAMFREAVPTSEYSVIDGADHSLQTTRPEAVAPVVAEFLNLPFRQATGLRTPDSPPGAQPWARISGSPASLGVPTTPTIREGGAQQAIAGPLLAGVSAKHRAGRLCLRPLRRRTPPCREAATDCVKVPDAWRWSGTTASCGCESACPALRLASW